MSVLLTGAKKAVGELLLRLESGGAQATRAVASIARRRVHVGQGVHIQHHLSVRRPLLGDTSGKVSAARRHRRVRRAVREGGPVGPVGLASREVGHQRGSILRTTRQVPNAVRLDGH